MEKINVNLSINELLPEIKFLASSLDDQRYQVTAIDKRVYSLESLFPKKKSKEEIFFYSVCFGKEMTTQEVRMEIYNRFPQSSQANKSLMMLLGKIYPASGVPAVGLNAVYENNHKHYLVMRSGKMNFKDDGIWPADYRFIFVTKEKIEL